MLKFVVKNVIKQGGHLTFVVIEPIKQPLFLEKEIQPGCIQHIIPILIDNECSKETCDRMCDILCNINMDDDTSRNFYTLCYFKKFFL